jgi:hypothetical protein
MKERSNIGKGNSRYVHIHVTCSNSPETNYTSNIFYNILMRIKIVLKCASQPVTVMPSLFILLA